MDINARESGEVAIAAFEGKLDTNTHSHTHMLAHSHTQMPTHSHTDARSDAHTHILKKGLPLSCNIFPSTPRRTPVR